METVDKIFAVLEEKNYSQQFLADALGIDKSTLSSWKSGKTKSYMKYLDKLSLVLNVSKDWLLGKSDKRERVPERVIAEKKTSAGILDSIIKGITKKDDIIEILELDDVSRNRIKSNIIYFAAKEGDTYVTALQKIKVSSSFAESLNKGGAVFTKDVKLIADHYKLNFNLFVGADLTFETGKNLAKMFHEQPYDKDKLEGFCDLGLYVILLDQGYCPSPVQIECIAEAFGVDIIDLPIPYNELCRLFKMEIGISEAEVEMLRQIRKLNTKGKQLVSSYLDDISAVYSK